MPVILVIIIVVAWIVILGPNMMKRRSRTVTGSISHFHRALRTLEHAAPEPIVSPAYRLRSVSEAGGPGPGVVRPETPAMPVLTAVGADRLPRPALAFLGDPWQEPDPVDADRPSMALAPAPGWRDPAGPAPAERDGRPAFAHGRAGDVHARRLARRRRRDTLAVLALVFVCTLLIGSVTGAGAAWIVSLVAGAALAGYVALLVRLRRAAEEREQKLRYLQPGPARSALGSGPASRAVYLSGRCAHPSNQAVAAR